MNPSARLDGGAPDSVEEVVWRDSERVVRRRWHIGADGGRQAVLVVLPAAEHPTPDSLNRLAHEYELRDDLDGAWAARPLELVRECGRTVLLLESPDGEPLDRLIGPPMEVERYLRLAIALSAALGRLHERGLIHKDIKPANVLVNCVTDQVWLTGFGVASRLPRERQLPVPPEFVAGTLAYMAPEQTGRMNRSIDSRSDLYSLGITLYQMLTGKLPFTASDPIEWVHFHIAKKPATPSQRLPDVPAPISAIIMKLLAKTAEERYQTAAGVENDLRRCLAAWKARGRINDFPLGEHDTPDRLLIAEKLYGRKSEIETLLGSFERIVASGIPELVLVSGYSGVGKSSVVNELHKWLAPTRGLFASGKFDQYKRDIPCASLAQALQTIVQQLLTKNEGELRVWRDDLRHALGPNGRLMDDLVPELKLIIGEQPPVLVLPPQDARRRFELVFRRFIAVFARADHPLALFLDDLQWLDEATLDLLEDLLTHPDVQHLMLIGAYRANEVDSTHPLMRKLEAIRKAGVTVREIALAPLAPEDLSRLIADSVHCELECAAPLAQLIHEKTDGNPFFAVQFISSLEEQRLLSFDRRRARWSWDLDRIHAKCYTDNVVDLMVGKLSRLPVKTRRALQQLACLGNKGDFVLLAKVFKKSEDEMHSALAEAAKAGLIFKSEDEYRFLHDRVQEAAYSLIDLKLRPKAHLRIGRLLAAHTPRNEREETIFEIVNQLNRGATLIASRQEREHLAELNLIAGKRAMASTAYTCALNYLTAGAALLRDDAWERRRAIIFFLELHQAECEFLTGRSEAADERLIVLSSRVANTIELATVTCLRMDLYTTLGQSDRAVAVCFDYLRYLGIEWSPHPTEDEARREYARIWSQLGDGRVAQLIELPLMSDPASLATIDVLTRVFPPALFTDATLLSLAVCRAVNLSIEGGNSDGSCVAYVWLGQIAGPHFANYKAGFEFARLGHDLVEKRGLKRFQASTFMVFASHVMPWTKHIRLGRDLLHQAFEAANKSGDLCFAAYSAVNLNTNLLEAGEPLAEVQHAAESGLEFAQKARFGLVIDLITVQLAFVRSLRGSTERFGSFDDGNFAELRFERHLANDPALTQPECFYWIRKLQTRYLAGDYASALEASERAKRLLWAAPSNFEMAEYHLYDGLCRAACWESASFDKRQLHFEALAIHHGELQAWAENCPENFEDRAALIGAEMARIENRELDAEQLYEQAIRSAGANGFVHNEAIAYERASTFYRARGLDRIAELYLRNARGCYLRWGADGKVRQLDEMYPHLSEEERVLTPTSTIRTPVDHLDLATVIKVSQAVSGEIVLEKLLQTLMRTAIEHAGAERGLLILSRGSEHLIAAEAATSGDVVTVLLRDEPPGAAALPQLVFQYVLRTRESVILEDARDHSPFGGDPYIRQHHARSILCLPLLNQAKFIGLLYLENNLAPSVFVPARIAVLRLLASQAAISLENTRLYRDLAEREAKVRRLVDANIIGIFICALEGQIIEANDAFLHMVGYDREDLTSGRLSWTDLTPTEWGDHRVSVVAELKRTGTFQPYEEEYSRKGGGCIPVLVGGAALGEPADQAVVFVVDLTERKQTEVNLRESERRYHEAQMELAHANRVATLGQLSASIGHEVNQPIAAAVNNASAALRWLGKGPPDLEKAQQALGRIVANGNRASEVIGRMRALLKKAPLRTEDVDINEAVVGVIALTHGEITRNTISLQTQLAEGLPLIQGDRVQLQQVILNLIMNAVEALGAVGEESRELTISTGEAQPEGIIVEIRDSGPGLPPAALDRVFDAFYTTKSGGLGMGLSICLSIIKAHGGRLWATGNRPQGASFQFTLPASIRRQTGESVDEQDGGGEGIPDRGQAAASRRLAGTEAPAAR